MISSPNLWRPPQEDEEKMDVSMRCNAARCGCSVRSWGYVSRRRVQAAGGIRAVAITAQQAADRSGDGARPRAPPFLLLTDTAGVAEAVTPRALQHPRQSPPGTTNSTFSGPEVHQPPENRRLPQGFPVDSPTAISGSAVARSSAEPKGAVVGHDTPLGPIACVPSTAPVDSQLNLSLC